MVVRELIDDLPAVPERVSLQVMDGVRPGSPAGIERVEGLLDGKLAPIPVTEICIAADDRDEASERVGGGDVQFVGGAIDTARMCALQVNAAAQEIFVLE